MTNLRLKKHNDMYAGVHFSDSIRIQNLQNKNLLLSDNTVFNISPETTLITEEGKEINMSEICFKEHIIVVRFNEFSCLDCVFQSLEELCGNHDDSSSQDIILLASYKNNRHLYLNKRLNNITLPVYNIPHHSLSNSMDDENIPYIFILDKSYRATHLFIPSKEYKEDLKEYLYRINKQLQLNIAVPSGASISC